MEHIFWWVAGGAILLAVYLAIQRHKEEVEARRVAEERQREYEKQQKEKRQRELLKRQEASARLQGLLASRKIIHPPNNEIVLCGTGGEPYKFSEFVVKTERTVPDIDYEEVWGDTPSGAYTLLYTRPVHASRTVIDKEFGCPVHRSTLFQFRNQDLNNYKPCGKCGYWWRSGPVGSSQCPVCTRA